MTVFERIKEISDKRGLSLRTVATKAGLKSETAIYRYNQGVTPRKTTLMAIADVLGVSVNYLLGEDDTPEWATEKDTHDLQKFLEQNEGSMTYGGEKLTEEDKEKLKIAMTQIFWRRHKHN